MAKKKNDSYNYYKEQLSKINFKSDYSPKFKVTDGDGNSTNFMDLNPDSITVILEWLSKELAESIKGLSGAESTIDFHRINNDVNGNPRYVVHFLDLLTEGEKNNTVANLSIEGKYKIALLRAKKIGGRKYDNKQYGGGIVFQSYNNTDLEKRIKELTSGGKKSVGSVSDRYKTEVGDEKIAVIKNRKEKIGYPVYAIVTGHAPVTVDVYPTKKKAIAKAKQLEKQNKSSVGSTTKSKSDDLILEIAKRGEITEKEMKLLLKRKNAGEKLNDAPIWDGEIELSKDQTQKGLKWLKNLWKSPTGKERSTNPFGMREEAIVDDANAKMYLKGFYNAGNASHDYYIPLYEVAGDNTTMEYYVKGGKISIVG